MQQLTLPIDACQLNAGYKAPRYRQEWGYNHYGVDLIDRTKTNRQLRGMGEGTVIVCGMDGSNPTVKLGNCIVIVYKGVQLGDGRVIDLTCRMFHMDKINVKPGDLVYADTIIGVYGNTGAKTTGPHLHIEFDTDTKYPTYAYGIATSGNVIKRGSVDSTINPCEVFCLGNGQRITTQEQWVADGWVQRESLDLPNKDDSTADKRIAELEAELSQERALRIKAESNQLEMVSVFQEAIAKFTR